MTWVASGNSNTTFNFNGGTLKAGASSTTFMTGLTNAFVKSGGAKINTNGKDITIGQALFHDTALGGTADGGLTKSGGGILTLSNTNTYTGATTVSNGTLKVSGSIGSSRCHGEWRHSGQRQHWDGRQERDGEYRCEIRGRRMWQPWVRQPSPMTSTSAPARFSIGT